MTTATLSAAAPGSSRSRVSWWRELALLAALYGVYMLARALVGVHPAAAMDRGRWLLDLEASARIDIERPLNSAVHAVPVLAVLADYVYASLHYLVTPLVLVWLAVRHRDGYRRGRNALLHRHRPGPDRLLAAPDRPSPPARRQRLPRHDGRLQRLGLVGRGRQRSPRHGGPEQPVRRAAVAACRLGAVVCAAGAGQHEQPRAAPLGLDLPGADHSGRDGDREPLPARRRRRSSRRPAGTRHRAAVDRQADVATRRKERQATAVSSSTDVPSPAQNRRWASRQWSTEVNPSPSDSAKSQVTSANWTISTAVTSTTAERLPVAV